MSDSVPAAAEKSAKRPWTAPHVIEAAVATESQNTVPFPGVDHYEAYFPDAGS